MNTGAELRPAIHYHRWRFSLIPQCLILRSQCKQDAFVPHGKGRLNLQVTQVSTQQCPLQCPLITSNHSCSSGTFCVLTSLTRASTLCLRLKAYVYVAAGRRALNYMWRGNLIHLSFGLWRCIWARRPEEMLIKLFSSESRLIALTLPPRYRSASARRPRGALWGRGGKYVVA